MASVINSSFSADLLRWFDQHGRKDLPWQKNTTPYRVWISEIMLQQTQVATVIPYYQRFMARFSSIDQLASASLDEVLHLWTGLGYYARARNLHATAKIVMQNFNGEFPLALVELESLPGIGRSTAGAIVAICTGKRAVILDGNVKRVIARYFAVAGWPGTSTVLKQHWLYADSITPEHRLADYTQAIMDLGAMVCTRSKPDCGACPLQQHCIAFETDAISQYPWKKPKKTLPVKKTCMLVIEAQGKVFLEKRPMSGLWGGLWGFPESQTQSYDDLLDRYGISRSATALMVPFRHTFTHFHLDITPLKITADSISTMLNDSDQYRWYDVTAPSEIGLTKPVTIILEMLINSTT